MANEQIGNSSWTTMTPGSAVAGQLQEILTSKRLEARQAMLDQLKQRDIESEISARAAQANWHNENAKSLADNRASEISDRAAQEVKRRAELYAPGQDMPTGSDADFFEKQAPNLMIPSQPGTAPLGPEDQGPSMPAVSRKFRGFPVQIEAQRKSQVQQDAMDKLNSADPKTMDPWKLQLLIKQATGAFEPTLSVTPKKMVPQYAYNEATGKDEPRLDPKGQPIMGPEGEKPVIRSRPPTGPQPPTPIQLTYTDKVTNEKVPVLVDHRGNVLPFKGVPDNLSFQGKMTSDRTPLVKPPKLSDKTWTEFLNARAAYLKAPTDRSTQNMQTTVAKKVIKESTLDPMVEGFLSSAWDHPEARIHTAEEILSASPESISLNDKQLAEIKSIWGTLKSNE